MKAAALSALLFLTLIFGFRAWQWHGKPDCEESPWSKPICFSGGCMSARTETGLRPPFWSFIIGRRTENAGCGSTPAVCDDLGDGLSCTFMTNER